MSDVAADSATVHNTIRGPQMAVAFAALDRSGRSDPDVSARPNPDRRPRLSLSRDETVVLLYAIESIFDEFAANEAHLIERESALYERLQGWLRRQDRKRGFRW